MRLRVRRGFRAACHAALASFDAAADGSGDVSIENGEKIREALTWLDSGKEDLPSRARRLMVEMSEAINSELYAAGPDETKQHPMLRSKARLLDRVGRYLKETE